MLDFSATPLAPSCRFLQNEVEDSSLFLRISQDLGNVKGFTDGLNGLNRMLLAYSSSSSKINPATILKLVQIARDTLLRSGVRIHAAAPCSPHMILLKRRYFSFLRSLKYKRSLFPVGLQDQVSRLVLPLASAALLRNSSQVPSKRPRCATCTATKSDTRFKQDDSCLMPPPDKFPPRSSLPSPRRRKPIIFPPEMIQQYLHGMPDNNSDTSDEDEVEQEDSRRYVLKPLTRRFGIWCGSTTMFRGPRD